MHRKAPRRSKGRGHHLIVGDANLPTGLFARIHLGYAMCRCTWEDPEINPLRTQNQAKQDD